VAPTSIISEIAFVAKSWCSNADLEHKQYIKPTRTIWSPLTLDRELAGGLSHSWQVTMPNPFVVHMLLNYFLLIHAVFFLFISSLTLAHCVYSWQVPLPIPQHVDVVEHQPIPNR
jgi:hypothetical protein